MRSLYVVMVGFFFCSSIACCQGRDELLLRLEKAPVEDQIEVLHQLVIKTWLNYPDEAISYAHQAYKLSLDIQDRALVAKSLRLIGGVHYYKNNYDSVLHYCTQSLEIAVEIDDAVLINNALNNIGLAYYNLGSYQSALENLLRSLNMKIAVGEIYGRALTMNNIGLVYNKLKDYERAREYFGQGLQVAREYNDPNLMLYSQNNIGTTYLMQGDIDAAKMYFEQSLALDVDNKNWNAVAFSGLGRVYQLKGEYELSRDYFERALNLRQEIGERNGVSEIYYYYGKEAQRRGNYDSAVSLLQESQRIAKEIGSRERMYENYSLFVELYQQQGQLEKSFEYQTRLLQLRDTLFNEGLAHNLSAIQLKIQEEENQKLLRNKEQQLSQNRKFNIFLITIFVLAVSLAGFIFYAYTRNRKLSFMLGERNSEIIAQKEEIEAQKESLVSKNIQLEQAHILITEQNNKLEKYNAQLRDKVDQRTHELEQRNRELKLANLELDNFLYKSSHNIKGPLATLMGVCNVALMDVKDEQSLKYFSLLAETAGGLNDILARLKTISDINSLQLTYKKINLPGLIDNCITQMQNIEGSDRFDITYDIAAHVNLISDPILVDLIFFNMIQNAVKFQDNQSDANFLKITISREQDTTVIHFRDNGIGIDDEDIHDIFQMFSKTALRHQTLGLGLYIVKQCVHRLQGEIMLLNDNDQYTHFRITLPIV
ncbi:hypothetical protein C900_01655 [Fulvivirga imtechensis AK7]|uniref:histidine kinase n=1 Tax=Fulvivirga imtechensis AK7 TaxID=1237149 RepID=L8JW00_9BACT|nr:tetratricopeptide repeat-containing sensor histidine kinase [Fulvivirga imtechensis]ELR72373.1 hypothetical protein C900_01655 [Fulvivirga imtechensis AK7]